VTADDVAWLIHEVREELYDDRVGLYLFVWILHARYPDAHAKDLLNICRPALDEILREPEVTLGWYVWGEADRVGPASEADLDDHAFDDIGEDGRYLAIDRT
jgi:hypothetical protein